MVTFTFFSSRHNTLHLRITNNRKKVEMDLYTRATKEELANALSPRPSGKNRFLAADLNIILGKLQIIKSELLSKGMITVDPAIVRDIVKERLYGIKRETPEEKANVVALFEKCINLKKSTSYRNSCRYTLQKMRAFDPNADKLRFDDINVTWLYDFEAWLAADGASVNTRAIHFKNLRMVFNRAIDEELTAKYPFRRFRIKTEKTRKRSLPVEELRKLFSYPVEPHQEIYRDMFKLIFLLCGINGIDLFNLEKVTAGRIEYRRSKTGRLYSIKVEPEARLLIERYRGRRNLLMLAERWSDCKDFLKVTNNNLQRIGEYKRVGLGGKKVIDAMWPELTTYWARHSWATIAASLDISKDTIAHALGHGENTVTDIYIDFDQEKVDIANRKVIDWVLYGKK